MQACNLLWDFSVPGCNEEQRLLLYFNVIPGRRDGGSQRSLNLSPWPWTAALRWGGCLCCSEAGWQMWAGRSRSRSRWRSGLWSCGQGRWQQPCPRPLRPALADAVSWPSPSAPIVVKGHLDDALDWDEEGVPHTPAHIMAGPEFP